MSLRLPSVDAVIVGTQAQRARAVTTDATASATPRRTRLHFLTLTPMVLALAGCPRPLVVSRPYPPPSASELGEALAARQSAVSSMNARARATSWLGGERVRATVLMLVDRPGRLRFEAEVSLQGTVAVLATDGRQFEFLDVTRNEFRHGPACAANVASLIRIPLEPPEIAAILLGDARLPTGASGADAEVGAAGATVDWDAGRAADVLVLRRHDGWMRILFERGRTRQPGGRPENRVVGVIATGPDGRARWRAGFEDFTEVATGGQSGAGGGGGEPPTVVLPRTIRFAEGDTSFDEGVEIKFKERTLNEGPGADAFALAPAPGIQTIEVGCPSAPRPPRPKPAPVPGGRVAP
jgi:hypothetical protein